MNEHTYISMSTDKYSFELDPRASFAGDNICRGNMDRELGSSLSNGQFLAFVTHTMNWLNNYYIPQTYPLHHPANLRIVGRNEQLEELNREGFINTNPLGRAKSCALPGIINNRIFRHSHPRTSNHGYSMYRYEEYLNPGIRAEDYIKAIKYSDLPCHECTFVSNCVYHPILALLYDNTELSVEDEAYLGLMYEYWFISKYMPEGDEYLQYVESTNIPYHTKEEIVEHSHRLTWIARAYRVLSDRDYLEDHYEELQENLIHTAVHELIQLLKSDLIDPNKVYKFAVALVEEHGIECYPQFINYVTSEDGFEDLTFNDKEHQSSLSERMEAVLGTTDILGNIPDTEPPTANIAFEQEFPTNDDDEEISDAERAIRWATSMGGGAQNL
jgi:hypothetical protein